MEWYNEKNKKNNRIVRKLIRDFQNTRMSITTQEYFEIFYILFIHFCSFTTTFVRQKDGIAFILFIFVKIPLVTD